MFKKNSFCIEQPLISVCIPVFHTEKYLARCLKSVISQDLDNFEIICVNDGSDGVDENGLSCKKIVKQAEKSSVIIRKKMNRPPVLFTYIENSINMQTIETRRTLIEAAKAPYITMLDSDDELLPGALNTLYTTAKEDDTEIIHAQMEIPLGTSKMVEGINAQSKSLHNKEIINSFLKQEHSGYLCAKLISRDVYLRAFAHIPFTKCVMADDLLIYFFIALEAKSYKSIHVQVYRYDISTGISSHRKINTLSRWEQICSAANVFTVLFDELCNLPPNTLTEEQIDRIRIRCRCYLANNINQLYQSVIPELQKEARAMLCEYWGEDFVDEVEKQLKLNI